MESTETRSIRIAASVETLWELLTTTAKVPSWYDSWDSVSFAAGDEELTTATSFNLVRYQNGQTQIAHCRVTELAPPYRLAWVEVCQTEAPVLVEFKLEPGPTSDTVLVLSKTF